MYLGWGLWEMCVIAKSNRLQWVKKTKKHLLVFWAACEELLVGADTERTCAPAPINTWGRGSVPSPVWPVRTETGGRGVVAEVIWFDLAEWKTEDTALVMLGIAAGEDGNTWHVMMRIEKRHIPWMSQGTVFPQLKNKFPGMNSEISRNLSQFPETEEGHKVLVRCPQKFTIGTT